MKQLTLPVPAEGLRFNGPTYDSGLDQARLTGQILRIYDLMRDGCWRSLPEIHEATGDPEASISAQLRHLRKPRFGQHDVQKQRRGVGGLWEYRVIQKVLQFDVHPEMTERGGKAVADLWAEKDDR